MGSNITSMSHVQWLGEPLGTILPCQMSVICTFKNIHLLNQLKCIMCDHVYNLVLTATRFCDRKYSHNLLVYITHFNTRLYYWYIYNTFSKLYYIYSATMDWKISWRNPYSGLWLFSNSAKHVMRIDVALLPLQPSLMAPVQALPRILRRNDVL